MLIGARERSSIAIPAALRLVGLVTGTWAIAYVLAAVLAYVPGHPEFSLFTTYLSDIGDTEGWPQIFFNSGTLIAAPLRYLVLTLIVLRMMQLGTGRAFVRSALSIGFASTLGTVFMTATPVSVSRGVHMSGIALYFVGAVALQLLLFFRQWSIREIPRILPALSLTMVVVYVAFVAALMSYMSGSIGRGASVFLEWSTFASSIVWLFAQALLLGRRDVAD